MGLTAYIVGKSYILMRSQYYWFTCQNSNDIISFIKENENMCLRELIKIL